MKIISIIGKENVGKSTLFNKLCHEKISIVNNQPGVTRDYINHLGRLFDFNFELIDTPGWYIKKKNEIILKVKTKTISAINISDIIFFIVDARSLLTIEDLILAKVIKKVQKKTFILANKSESITILKQKDLKRLGFGEGIFISAEHKLGFETIYKTLKNNIKETTEFFKQGNYNLSVGIIGRPNVGKSKLFNSILNFERSLVSHVSGTTRDYLIHKININRSKFNLIDTAGVRKKSKIQEKIEELSIKKTIYAMKLSDVILLIMDSKNLLEKQDLILANLALENSKLLIPIINKQDFITNIHNAKFKINCLLKKTLPQIKNIFTIFISAQNKFNKNLLFKIINNLWDLYNIKISTSKLNDWLNIVFKINNMPITKNNIKLKIRYMKQILYCPPTFNFFINIANKIQFNKNFERFLINSLRKKFSLSGIIIKVYFILSKNPYLR